MQRHIWKMHARPLSTTADHLIKCCLIISQFKQVKKVFHCKSCMCTHAHTHTHTHNSINVNTDITFKPVAVAGIFKVNWSHVPARLILNVQNVP